MMPFDGIFCRVSTCHQLIKLLVSNVNFKLVEIPNLVESQFFFFSIFELCFYDTIFMKKFNTIALSSCLTNIYQFFGQIKHR
jgi:hypothetical protein